MSPIWIFSISQIIIGASALGNSKCDELGNGVGIPAFLVASGIGKLVVGSVWIYFYDVLFLHDDSRSAGSWVSTLNARRIFNCLATTEAAIIGYGMVVSFHNRLSESECPAYVHTFSVIMLLVLCIIAGCTFIIPLMAGIPMGWHLPPPQHEDAMSTTSLQHDLGGCGPTTHLDEESGEGGVTENVVMRGSVEAQLPGLS